MSERLEGVEAGFEVTLDGPADGRRVLLLHGFPQDRTSWDAVVDQLVAAGWRCARFDQRGYDARVRPDAVEDYRLPLLVGDALSVLEGLGWSQATVVGHDWGAVVAWALAASHPRRIDRLVTVSVPHPTAYGRAFREDPDQQQRSAYIRLFRLEGKAEEVLLADDAAALRALYAGIDGERVAHYVTRFGDRATLTAALAWYRAMDVEAFGDVGLVTVPTRFIWGADDIAVGRAAAEGCAEFVRGDGQAYEFVELPDVGHWVPETAPEVIVEAVVR